jgi:steroid delta-isomerase-like uncharacterized protein
MPQIAHSALHPGTSAAPPLVQSIPPRRSLRPFWAIAIGAGLCLSCLEPASAARARSPAEHERAVRRYFDEVWNAGHLDVLDELLATDYVNHTPSTPNPPPGPGGLKPIVTAIRSAFPDLRFDIEDILVDGDKVAVRVRMRGTHQRSLFGLPATGKTVDVEQINIEHFVGSKIREHWRVTDELSLLRQLGAVPPTSLHHSDSDGALGSRSRTGQ